MGALRTALYLTGEERDETSPRGRVTECEEEEKNRHVRTEVLMERWRGDERKG